MHYNPDREQLFIFDEIYQQKLGNRQAVEKIAAITGNREAVIADSAEPRTIREFKDLGLSIYPARKGADSVEHGIKWLQFLDKIYIDKHRCPNTYREFTAYEYEKNKNGQFISAYPDKDNHTIDAVRYGTESLMRKPLTLQTRRQRLW